MTLFLSSVRRPATTFAAGRVVDIVRRKWRGGARCFSTTSSTLQDDDSPTFKVAKLTYQDGRLETVELKIAELLKSTSIFARDLFALDLQSRQEKERQRRLRVRLHRAIPSIVPRETVVILSFGNIRAVAGLDCIFFFNAHNIFVQEFAEELATIYKENEQEEPNELIFLERVLKHTVDSFHRRLGLYEPIVDSLLVSVEQEVYSETGGVAHQLGPLKDSLKSFELQVQQSLDCLTDLLEKDDEMLELLLTEQAHALETGRPVAFVRHDHVELLLGVYARQLANLQLDISYLLGRLQSKQEFVALALSQYRNRMVRMNVHLGICGLALGLGTTIAGYFGMNLTHGLEGSPVAFYYVVGLSSLASVALVGGGMDYLSGRRLHAHARMRGQELETLSQALSDMTALDYTLKQASLNEQQLDKDAFSKTLQEARPATRVTQAELDWLFGVFDRVKDGQIQANDLKKQQQQPKDRMDKCTSPIVR